MSTRYAFVAADLRMLLELDLADPTALTDIDVLQDILQHRAMADGRRHRQRLDTICCPLLTVPLSAQTRIGHSRR